MLHRQPTGPRAGAGTHLFASGDSYFLEFPVAVLGVGADGQTWQEGETSGQPTVPGTHHAGALQRAPPPQFTPAQTATPLLPTLLRGQGTDCQNPTPSAPKPPGPAAPWQVALAQVGAWAWRDSSSASRLIALHLPPLLLQISTSCTGSLTLAWLNTGRPFSIHSPGTHMSVSPRSQLLELRGSQMQDRVFTYSQISAKEHAEPASCQERLQGV